MHLCAASLLTVLIFWVAVVKAYDVDDYNESKPPEKEWFKFHRTPETFMESLYNHLTNLQETNVKYRYDYSYDKETGGWFKFHRMPATFQDAFMRCHLEGAVLASPLDENLHKAMVNMIAASKTDCAVFTGIHATISKGDFTSIEGVPLEQISLEWAPSEPDNFEDEEDCIVISQKNGTAADVRCNNTYPFICYKKKTSSLKLTLCGPVESGYAFENKTGSCYKFHRHSQDWRRAQMICHAEGGHLAIINSAAEMQALKDLFARNPYFSIINAENTEKAALGFLDWDKKGSWLTVHGQTLEAAGYNSWASGQPNRSVGADDGPQYCGSMYRNGKFGTYWCENRPLAFICEKTPDVQYKEN